MSPSNEMSRASNIAVADADWIYNGFSSQKPSQMTAFFLVQLTITLRFFLNMVEQLSAGDSRLLQIRSRGNPGAVLYQG